MYQKNVHYLCRGWEREKTDTDLFTALESISAEIEILVQKEE